MRAEPDDTIPRLLAEQVRKRPDAPALYYGGATVSFAALDALARRAAHGLAALGIGPGDRIALWLPNTPAYLALWLACARLGAIAVAVNTRFRSAEVGDIVARSGARVMALWPGFRDIDFLAILSEIEPAALARLESLILYDEDGAEDGGGAAVPAAVGHCRRVAWRDLAAGPAESLDRAAPALPVNVFTTSGTSARPKFVLHGQGGIARQARQVSRHMGYDRGGAMAVFLPLCGVFGFCMATASLAAGAPMLLTSAFDPAAIVADLARYDVRHTNGPDDTIHALLEASHDIPALAGIRVAGYGIFNSHLTDLVERAEARGVTLVGLYGMSETLGIVSAQDPAAPADERRPGGGHLISRDYAIRAADPESGRILPHGEHGELQIKGPSVMQGYFENQAATAAAFTDDGFLRTGDLGYTTGGDHFIYLTRMGDVLRLGGFMVSPAEIESHLQRHPGVEAAQVVGVETARGLRPFGFVIPAAGQRFDEAALIAHCRAGLARFKAPVRILPLDAFPTAKSANATKIQRVKLREMAEAALAEDAARSA